MSFVLFPLSGKETKVQPGQGKSGRWQSEPAVPNQLEEQIEQASNMYVDEAS